MTQLWRASWIKITLLFGVWLLLLLSVALVFTRDQWLPFTPSYPYAETLSQSGLPPWLWRLGGFDGVHYLTLVRQGYLGEVGGIQAFFPLYPLLVRTLTFGVLPPLPVGLAVSLVCSWGFLQISFIVVRRWFNRRLAWWWLWVILFSPVSFFLICFYTESLFMLLLFTTLWAYQEKRWWLVGLSGILLAATRVFGICLPFCLVLDYGWHHWPQLRRRQFVAWRNLILIASGGLGLLVFSLFLWRYFGSPFYFFQVQADYNWGRQTSLVLLPQVFWRYLKNLALHGQTWLAGQGLNFFQVWATSQELLAATGGTAILSLAAWRRWRHGQKFCFDYVLGFSALALLLPPLTGTFASLPRYLMPVLIVYLVLARFFVRRKKIGVLLLGVSGVIMLFNLVLFIQGFWVA
jgi:hypothetical protein